MGVHRSNYVLLGFNIGMDYYDSEKFDDLYYEFSNNKKIGDLIYLIDGYNGDYFIIGYVLDCDIEGYNDLDFDLSRFSENDLSILKSKLIAHVKDTFNLSLEKEPSIIIKTHWT